jgi:5'-nucleotidase
MGEPLDNGPARSETRASEVARRDAHTSTSARKTILLDVDGVLADFTGPVCALASQVTRRDLKPENVTRFDFAACLDLTPEEKREVVRAIVAPGFWRSLPVFDGAIDGVRRLREVANVYICTSPWNSCPTWLHEREAWLYEHFGIPHANVIATGAKYRVSGDMLVDDKTETLVLWDHHQGCWWQNPDGTRGESRAVQWQTPHNRLDEWDGPSTRSWDQLLEWVRG